MENGIQISRSSKCHATKQEPPLLLWTSFQYTVYSFNGIV